MWGNYEEQDEPGKRKKKPIEELLPTPEVSPNASPIHNHVDNTPSNNRGKRIQRKRNKERAKCYRDNEKLRKEIEKQQRWIHNLRQRVKRNQVRMQKLILQEQRLESF